MIKVNHENKVWKVARVAIAILLVVMCAMTIVAAASGATYNVTIIDNSRSVTISTRAESLMAVLKEADISTDDNDIIVADDFVPGQPSTIRINRGYNVTVTYHGETFKTVGYKNVENVLRQEKLEITDKDIINFSLDNKLSDGMKIVIENPMKVEISVDGEVIVKDAFSANVATILSRCGIDLGEDDIVELTTEDGKKLKFYFVGTIEYKGKNYSAFEPAEAIDGIEDDDLVIFELAGDDEETADLLPVEDEKLLDEVFEEFCRVLEEDELADEAMSLEPDEN